MSFKQFDFDSNINKAIEMCGYTTPTPVQAQAIPPILEGKDVVASAQTGTGKTAAFVLPALQRLSQQKPTKKTRILILTPTRELATQITKAAGIYGKFLRFNIVSLVGGMPYHHQLKDLARGADIIVATPGRLMDHMESKRVDLSQVEMLVLDEADRMLDMGFIEDVEYIAKLTPANRQTLLFSATIDKQLATIVRHLLKNPVRIDLSNEKLAAPKIKQELYRANNPPHKLRLLKHILNDKNMFKAIIFTATKMYADKLATQLNADGYAAAALHGDLRQNVRNRTIDQLRRGKVQFLVATDVAARGLDISDITHVINYDLPRFSEDYVHRIGRTGRAGKEGVAISFVLPTDRKHLQNIERYLGTKMHVIQSIEGDAMPASDTRDTGHGAWREESTERRERFRHSDDRDHKRSSREGFSSRKKSSGHKDHGKSSWGDRSERGHDKPKSNDQWHKKDERRDRDHSFKKETERTFEHKSQRDEEKPAAREGWNAKGGERVEYASKRDSSRSSRFSKDKSEWYGNKDRDNTRNRDDARPRFDSKFKDESRSSKAARFKDDSRPGSGARFKEDARPRFDSRNKDDSRPRSDSRFKDDSRPRFDSRNKDDARPRSDSRFKDDSRPRFDSRNKDDARPRSGSRFKDDSRPRSDSRNKDDARPRSDSRFKDDSRPRFDSRNKDDARPRSGSRFKDDSRPRSDSRNKDDARPRSNSRFKDDSRPRSDSRNKDDARPRSGSRFKDDSRPRSDSRNKDDARPKKKFSDRKNHKSTSE